jgi:hypothetical protein
MQITILLCFSLFLICRSTSYDFSKQYVIQYDDLYNICDDNKVRTGVIDGTTIFEGAGETSSQVDSLTITGWFMLKSIWNMSSTLFYVLSDSKIIFALFYNPLSTVPFEYIFKTNSAGLNFPNLLKD